jgi:hypothetical protein
MSVINPYSTLGQLLPPSNVKTLIQNFRSLPIPTPNSPQIPSIIQSASQIFMELIRLPSIFTFMSIINSPLYLFLESNENDPNIRPFLILVRLFAFGTYQDYVNLLKDPSSPFNTLYKLDQYHITKLRMLSIISLADKKNVSVLSIYLSITLSI